MMTRRDADDDGIDAERVELVPQFVEELHESAANVTESH